MERERIITLLTRKLAGEISMEELSELEVLMLRYPDAVYYEEAISQIKIKEEFAEDDIEQIYALHRSRYAGEFPAEVQKTARRSIYARLLIPAAAILIMIAGFYILFNPLTPADQFNAEIIAGKGVRKSIRLPDGTLIWLNSGSKLRYDDHMLKKASREVSLEGEAFFDVVKNKHQPFIIHTQKITVKVLGTAFNIKAYREDSTTEATLIRGSIALSVNNSPAQQMVLKPKEKFALTESVQGREGYKRKLVIENVRPLEVAQKEYLEETSWVEDKLVFQNTTFDELVPILERWYNIKIVIHNSKLKSYAFTGIFENESIEQALQAMQLIRPFKFKPAKDGTIEIN